MDLLKSVYHLQGIAIARTVCIFTIYPYWYFYDYDIHGFQFMMHFIAGLLIFGSVVGILVTKAPCFKRKIATFTSKNFVDNEIVSSNGWFIPKF